MSPTNLQSSMAVLNWNTSESALLRTLLRDAQWETLRPEDEPGSLIERLSAKVSRVIVHVDLSLPGLYPPGRSKLIAALSSLGIDILNAQVTNITKRHVQKQNREFGLADAEASSAGDSDELIVIKTNFNSGGFPEKTETSGRVLQQIGYPAVKKDPLVMLAQLCNLPVPLRSYPVLKRSDIPSEIWLNDDLSFEKYIDNEEGLSFRVYFARNRMLCQTFKRTGDSISTSGVDSQLIRTESCSISDFTASPYQRILRAAVCFAGGFALDYGALDIVMNREGKPCVIDVNPTPSWDIDFDVNHAAGLSEGLAGDCG